MYISAESTFKPPRAFANDIRGVDFVIDGHFDVGGVAGRDLPQVHGHAIAYKSHAGQINHGLFLIRLDFGAVPKFGSHEFDDVQSALPQIDGQRPGLRHFPREHFQFRTDQIPGEIQRPQVGHRVREIERKLAVSPSPGFDVERVAGEVQRLQGGQLPKIPHDSAGGVDVDAVDHHRIAGYIQVSQFPQFRHVDERRIILDVAVIREAQVRDVPGPGQILAAQGHPRAIKGQVGQVPQCRKNVLQSDYLVRLGDVSE